MLAVVKIMMIVAVFPMITMMGILERKKKVEIVHILRLIFIK